MSPPQRLYLASRSPRRRELLQQMGVAFDTLLFRSGERSDEAVDETPLTGESASDYVVRVARAKAAFGRELILRRRIMLQPVLSADTTLEFDGEIIGKPTDARDAESILSRLSGQTHRVLTCVALSSGQSVLGESGIQSRLCISEVRFKSLSTEEIRRYVATGDPLDKAGAYGIQGRAGRFIAHLSGSYSGVMGLPLYETGELLDAIGFAP